MQFLHGANIRELQHTKQLVNNKVLRAENSVRTRDQLCYAQPCLAHALLSRASRMLCYAEVCLAYASTLVCNNSYMLQPAS